MSKSPTLRPPVVPVFELTDLTEDEISAARERARKKLADDIAMSELGLGDKSVAARKGPTPVPDEEQFTITLDLYEGSDRIILDGKTYMHGGTYTVGKRTYDTLCDINARGWAHQREIEGKDSNAYRKQQNLNATTGRPHQIPGRFS